MENGGKREWKRQGKWDQGMEGRDKGREGGRGDIGGRKGGKDEKGK
jgi:hypothetical protein